MTLDENLLKVQISTAEASAWEFKNRRINEWDETYMLYRDRVRINRLTQRQSVNVPLMKETISTIMSSIDDAPDIKFEDKGNDKQKEIYINEFWNNDMLRCNLELKDVIDKKQVLLFGRSFMQLNIVDNEITLEVIDPKYILVGSFVDPADIDSARYLCHIGIYKSIGELKENLLYNQAKVSKIALSLGNIAGTVEADRIAEESEAQKQRYEDIGISDSTAFGQTGETKVELKHHFIKVWDTDEKRSRIVFIAEGAGEYLRIAFLEDIMNINFFPYVTWSNDPERTDFWSDGIGDIVRTPNKIMNAWFSQLVENRTMRSMGMNYYNASDTSFRPDTFIAQPWGWYPVPGDPNTIIKRIDIPELSESIDEMEYVKTMTERATAATASEKGQKVEGQVTLGEVKIMKSAAQERITSTAKFYKIARKQLAEKWLKIIEANGKNINAETLYKKSAQGNYYPEKVSPNMWKSNEGYSVLVTSSAEQEDKNLDTIQKFQAVVSQFQNNYALSKIYKKKMLGLINLTPEEENEVMQSEENAINQANMMAGNVPPNPVDEALATQTKQLINPNQV